MSISVMTLKGLAELCRSGQSLELIDVCTPRDYREIHIESSHNVPLEQLDAKVFAADHRDYVSKPLYIVGRSGSRSQEACEKLHAAGTAIVVHVKGNSADWETAGIPVVHGIEARWFAPRISALFGLVAIMGSILGAFVHPVWLVFVLIAGLAVVFMGIEDA